MPKHLETPEVFAWTLTVVVLSLLLEKGADARCRTAGPPIQRQALGGSPVIALDKVDFAYGSKPVLERVSLVFPAAGTVCLFGPSGCGKTTILRLLAGLEVPAGGTVRGVDELRAAVVFQENRLPPWIPVWENVAMVHHGSDARERAMDCLERVGLADSAKSLSRTAQRRDAPPRRDRPRARFRCGFPAAR